ncbi:MAG: YncE family protein [Candidatus Angelobacter sp.]
MRRNSYLSQFLVAGLALALAGCGSSSKSNAPKPTGLKKRVLLSNTSTSTVNVMDAQKDAFSTKALGVTSPTKMLTAGGTTIAMDSSGSEITIIDDPTEAVTFAAPIGDQPFDIAISPDGKNAWAAMRNFGFVQSVDTTTGVARPVLRIGNARRLVMSPKGTKLLVFPDPQAQVPPNTNTFFVVDTATAAVQTITDVAHLDQPFTAVFNGSETQAFILNCGGECGGTAASVVFVDFTNPAANFSAPIPVSGATVGLMNGTNLYVAGTPATALVGPGAVCPLSRCGALTVINTSALTAGAAIPITDGTHEKMAFANNRIYVGASGCSVDPGTAANTVRGCLSIFNTATPGTVFPNESAFRQNFDVTGLQPISGRNIIYVVQGAEIDIFDTNTDALASGVTQLDVVGKAFDVVQIDP